MSDPNHRQPEALPPEPVVFAVDVYQEIPEGVLLWFGTNNYRVNEGISRTLETAGPDKLRKMGLAAVGNRGVLFAHGDKNILTDEGRSLRQELADAIYKFAERAAAEAGVRCESVGDLTDQKGLAMRALLMTAQLEDQLH